MQKLIDKHLYIAQSGELVQWDDHAGEFFPVVGVHIWERDEKPEDAEAPIVFLIEMRPLSQP